MHPITYFYLGEQSVNLIRRVCSALLITVLMSGISQAHILDDQRRAAYAGAYLSMSFGGDKANSIQPIQYGFSAGFRQRSFTGPNDNYSRQFGWEHSDINLIQNRDLQARVINLGFSDRGFEKMSVSGLSLVKRDSLGQITYFDDRFNSDGEGGKGGKILLWTGIAVGALGVHALASCLTQGCGNN